MQRRTAYRIFAASAGLALVGCAGLAVIGLNDNQAWTYIAALGFIVSLPLMATALLGLRNDNPHGLIEGYVINRRHTPGGWRNFANPISLVHAGVDGYYEEDDYALQLRDMQDPKLTGWVHVPKEVYDVYTRQSFYSPFRGQPLS